MPLLNLKNLSFQLSNAIEIEKYKHSIQFEPQNLIYYDFLAHHYILRGDEESRAGADFILTETKRKIFESFICYDPELLRDLSFDPFYLKSKLSDRLTHSARLNDLESFFENFPHNYIKSSFNHFERIKLFFPSTFQFKLLSILMNKRLWKDIYDRHQLMDLTQDYLDDICEFFDADSISLYWHQESLIKILKFLISSIHDKRENDRESIIYTAFVVALLAYMDDEMGPHIIENEYDHQELQIIKRIWGHRYQSFQSLLDQLWDYREKQ